MNAPFMNKPCPARPVLARAVLARAVAGVLMATVTAVLGTAATAVPATAQATTTQANSARATQPSPAMARDTYERRVQYWINRRRTHHDLPRLRFSVCADRVAERWSAHLAASGEFRHQSMRRVMARCGATYAGETLGRGTVGPRRLVTLWMHSPSHRAVLLSHRARRLGVGATPDSAGRWVVAAVFLRF